MPNPYLHGNFAPVQAERSDDHELPVTGILPPDLEGRLLRNGPNPVVVPPDESAYHWFAGDGMVHAITLGDGKALGYRCRMVRTRALAAKAETEPPSGPVEPLDGPANTHVIRHAGRTLALVESGFPHLLSDDLSRAKVYDFDGSLGSPMTAHPKVDPDSGELVFFGADVFGPPYLRYHVADASGRLVRTEEIETPRATMVHDVAVTATRVAFLDLPVVFDLELAAQGRSLPFRWMPEAGARIGVLARDGSGADVVWVDVEPCYAFHVVNAFDDGDEVVVDLLRYDRAFDTGPGEAISGSLPVLTRWSVDPVARRVREERLDDRPVELPRIDDASAGLPYRYAYCAGLGDLATEPAFGGIVKYDLARGESVCWEPGARRAAGEPVFVRAAGGRTEDEGWVLTVVYDAARDASDLVVLDATAMGGPPVATVHLPVRVPFGFHGSWVPAGA